MKLGFDSPNILAIYPHKNGVNPDDWSRCHNNLLKLAYFYVNFCESNNIPVLFTSIIRPMIKGVSKTDIHSKGRAFDVSAKGWTKELRDEFEKQMEEKFKAIAAVSAETGQPNAIYWHEGTALHGHCQVRP